MPSLLFSHPYVQGTLTVETGANDITWGYNLNTVSYPTYAGEVVQVLSVNIDELRITGEIKTYAKMEEIYRWFLMYMQAATQGRAGVSYSETPVKMEYPHRGWTMYIKPTALPSMRYGRDVVAPTWSLTAHVDDPDPEQRELTIDHAVNGDVQNFTDRVSADIGFRQGNPFSDPLAVLTREEVGLYPKANDIEGISIEGEKGESQPDFGKALSGLAKQMQAMFDALMDGNFKDLIDVSDASKPASGETRREDEDSGADKEERVGR